MVFCFFQNFFFGQHELEYLFFLLRKVRIFFPEYNIRLYDKHSESDYFFFPSTKIRIFFSATLGIRIFFQKKTITPPFKLNGRSLMLPLYHGGQCYWRIKTRSSIIISHYQSTQNHLVFCLITCNEGHMPWVLYQLPSSLEAQYWIRQDQ